MKNTKGLKVGDKVIVRGDLTQSMTFGCCCVVPKMEDLKGKEIEVKTIISDMGFEAVETRDSITWRVEMIEKKVYEFTKEEELKQNVAINMEKLSVMLDIDFYEEVNVFRNGSGKEILFGPYKLTNKGMEDNTGYVNECVLGGILDGTHRIERKKDKKKEYIEKLAKEGTAVLCDNDNGKRLIELLKEINFIGQEKTSELAKNGKEFIVLFEEVYEEIKVSTITYYSLFNENWVGEGDTPNLISYGAFYEELNE